MKKTVFFTMIVAVLILLFSVSCNDGSDGLYLHAAESQPGSSLNITNFIGKEGSKYYYLTDSGILENGKKVLSKEDSYFSQALFYNSTLFTITGRTSEEGTLNSYTVIDGLAVKNETSDSVLYKQLIRGGYALTYANNLVSLDNPSNTIVYLGPLGQIYACSDTSVLVEDSIGQKFIIKDSVAKPVLSETYFFAVGFEEINNRYALISSSGDIFLTVDNSDSFSLVSAGNIEDELISAYSYAASFFDNELAILVVRTSKGFSMQKYDGDKFTYFANNTSGYAQSLKNVSVVTDIVKSDSKLYIAFSSDSGVFELNLSGLDTSSKSTVTTTIKNTSFKVIFK